MISDSSPKLLVVGGDEQGLARIQHALSDEYLVLASDRSAAVGAMKSQGISVALLDLGATVSSRELQSDAGLQALDELLAGDAHAKVIVVADGSGLQNAQLALQKGAFDIFAKPVDLDELRIVVRRAYRRVAIERDSCDPEREPAATDNAASERMIGVGPGMQSVFSAMANIAQTNLPVLISGESGTGKEMAAAEIHKASPRCNGPFVVVNCATMSEMLLASELFGDEKSAFAPSTNHRRGRFEHAQGGTLFLDEIGGLAAPLQVKLLRFLQEGLIEKVGGKHPISVDCRVIAATHEDLKSVVREKRFREDLYFRLAVLNITLPPLRERLDDLFELAGYFVDVFSRELKRPLKKLSPAAQDVMRTYRWPGNVRELQNRLKRAVAISPGPSIGPGDLELDAAASSGGTLREAKQEFEREIVARKLRDTKGNISSAARALGISRPTLYELMSRYGLSPVTNP